MIEFEGFPKIARLNRDMVVTEKIDGTNAALIVQPLEKGGGSGSFRIVESGDAFYAVGAQSRKRLINPLDDNFGFARWVDENARALVDTLGEGRHFGEWWGSGIQRGYGLSKGEKRFSLFNTKRWGDVDFSNLPGVAAVPVLYQGPFSLDAVDYSLDRLREGGSLAAPGFMNPEGVVVYHVAANHLYKATIHGDDVPKGIAA